MSKTNKTYDAVASRILKIMETGKIPWVKPWNTPAGLGSTENLVTGHRYRGINTVTTYGFECPYFLTFNQAKELGAHVKRGASGVPVVYWVNISKEDKNEETEETEKRSFLIPKHYVVFNACDVEGLPERWQKIVAGVTAEHAKPLPPRHDEAEEVIKATRADIRHQNVTRAFYSPSLDYINMPKLDQFSSVAEYYSTMFHELGHWTGSKDRLNRRELTEAKYFGSHEYSKEELTAELTAAFVCSYLNISTESTERNSAAYLQSWLKALKNDPRMLIDASQRAHKAADYILKREVSSEKD